MAFVSVFTIQQGFSKLLALATPHQPALPVPKCRQAWQLPPGGSQGAVAGAGSIQRSALFHPQMRGFAAWVANLATPTVAVQNHGIAPFTLRHSLSQPVRADSSLREGAKAASPLGSPNRRPLQGVCDSLNACENPTLREAKSLPYSWRTKPGKRRDKFFTSG